MTTETAPPPLTGRPPKSGPVTGPSDQELDPDELARALEQFGGTEGERRTVARQASDLAASGKHAHDRSHPLTVDVVLDQLSDAREGGPADRWNWWMGALDVAYGGYEPFQVVRFPRE